MVTNATSIAGQLFSTLVVQALQGLQQLSGYDNNPDMADDTFLLISRGVRYSPGVVYNPQMLPIIVDAAMIGVLVQHRSAKNPAYLVFSIQGTRCRRPRVQCPPHCLIYCTIRFDSTWVGTCFETLNSPICLFLSKQSTCTQCKKQIGAQVQSLTRTMSAFS